MLKVIPALPAGGALDSSDPATSSVMTSHCGSRSQVRIRSATGQPARRGQARLPRGPPGLAYKFVSPGVSLAKQIEANQRLFH